MAVKYMVKSENGVHTIVIQNHSKSREYFKSDDMELVKQRASEIEQDIQKAGTTRAEVLVALYRFAGERGTIAVWKSRGAIGAVLKVKPEGKNWVLVLARGKQEIILERKDNMTEVKNKYIDLMKKKANDPSLFTAIWDYAMAKQKVELRDAQ